MVPRENKNNAYAKFGGTNKEYYGIFRTGIFVDPVHELKGVAYHILVCDEYMISDTFEFEARSKRRILPLVFIVKSFTKSLLIK